MWRYNSRLCWSYPLLTICVLDISPKFSFLWSINNIQVIYDLQTIELLCMKIEQAFVNLEHDKILNYVVTHVNISYSIVMMLIWYTLYVKCLPKYSWLSPCLFCYCFQLNRYIPPVNVCSFLLYPMFIIYECLFLFPSFPGRRWTYSDNWQQKMQICVS